MRAHTQYFGLGHLTNANSILWPIQKHEPYEIDEYRLNMDSCWTKQIWLHKYCRVEFGSILTTVFSLVRWVLLLPGMWLVSNDLFCRFYELIIIDIQISKILFGRFFPNLVTKFHLSKRTFSLINDLLLYTSSLLNEITKQEMHYGRKMVKIFSRA